MLWSCDLVYWCVKNLTTEHSALQLPRQQGALSLGTLHEATVLLSTTGQIWNNLVDWAVWDVLVDWETGLTCFQHKAQRQFQLRCLHPVCIQRSVKNYMQKNTSYMFV